MAHFAELDGDKKVIRVCVVDNAHVPSDKHSDGETWCVNFFGGGTWKQTSYGNNFRKQYAGIGMTYDSVKDKFIAVNPFPSWKLDENDEWQPPVPFPDDHPEVPYVWDEENLKFELYINDHVLGSEDEKDWLYTKEQLVSLNKLVNSEGKPVDEDGNIL